MGVGAGRAVTAWRSVLVALVIVALGPTASALAMGGQAGVKVRVRPTVGSRRAPFVVSFTAQRTGFIPSTLGGYRVTASTRAAHECVSAAGVTVATTSQGQRVFVSLRPGGRSRVWCRGTYGGRVEEILRPTCGFREMCPLVRQRFPTFIGFLTVARFSFRVR